jgi:GPH family glycoside/pentoside/hexuronide:cation symporter
VQYFTLKLVKLFGQGSDARGWQMTMVLYGFVAIVLLQICLVSTRERVTPSRKQKANLQRELCDLFNNRPWWILVGVQLLTVSAFAIEGSVSAYYFKYFVKRQDLLGLFLASNGLAYLVAVLVTSHLARLVGKKKLFIVTLGIGSLVMGLFSFARPSDVALIFVLQIISSFMLGFKSPLVFAMFADTADHAEWRTGRRATGLILASAIFSTKIGMAIGGWLFGVILAYCGYVANVEQAAHSLRWIILSMSWIPCALLILATAAMVLYQLDDIIMEKIEEDLKLRRVENGG